MRVPARLPQVEPLVARALLAQVARVQQPAAQMLVEVAQAQPLAVVRQAQARLAQARQPVALLTQALLVVQVRQLAVR